MTPSVVSRLLRGLRGRSDEESGAGFAALPTAGRVSVAVVCLIGTLAAVAALLQPGPTVAEAVTGGVLGVAVAVSDRVGARLGYRDGVTASIDTLFVTAGILVLAPRALVLLAAVSFLLEAPSRRLHQRLVNLALIGVSALCVAMAAELLFGRPVREVLGSGDGAAGVLGAGIALVLVTLVPDGVLRLVMRLAGAGADVAAIPFRRRALEDLTINSVGVVLALLWLSRPAALVFLVLPVMFLQRLVHYSEVLQASRRDSKTGLLNAVAFREQVARDLTTSATGRRRRAAWVVMIDVDHLREVNNTHGHLVGDLVIGHVAAALRKATRRQDLIGRFGGDEFLLYLRDATQSTAIEVAERVRRGVAAPSFAEPGGAAAGSGVAPGSRTEPARVVAATTVSVGIARALPGEDVDEVIGRADRAAYAAKAAGRNAVRLDRVGLDPRVDESLTAS